MLAIIVPTVVVGGAGLACAAALAAAARMLAVREDPRIGEVLDVLPGANCGGCGYAGCEGYAKAVVTEGAPVNLCTPGGEEVARAVAGILGVDAQPVEKKVAIVLCGGDDTKAGRRFAYNGVADCRAANAIGGGDKKCRYGCLGYGSCAQVCPVGAIEITDRRLAVVHPDLCIGCGLCVDACPRSIIKLVPAKRTVHVLCSSRDRGAVVKRACTVGCVGCGLCAKLSGDGAIRVRDRLAVIDYSKDLTGDGIAEKCPSRCIVIRGN
jgi:Na+-translocating ferredoxin:NAD+ oxidoreductase RNF subunit RnfB